MQPDWRAVDEAADQAADFFAKTMGSPWHSHDLAGSVMSYFEDILLCLYVVPAAWQPTERMRESQIALSQLELRPID